MSGRRQAVRMVIGLGLVAATATGCGSSAPPGSAGVTAAAHASLTPTSPAPSTSAPSTSAASPTTAYDGPMLAAGEVTTGDRVPWAKVGSGWYLTSIDQGTRNGGGGMNDTAELLDLVDPLGGRYQMLKLPVGKDNDGRFTLEDWSSDGRTALLRTSSREAIAVDLATGTRRSVAVPWRYDDVRLDPDGDGVIAIALSPGGRSTHPTRIGHLDKISWDGTTTRLTNRGGLGVLASPDRSRLVIGAANFADRTMQVVSTTDWTVQQTLVTPFPCLPQRWWDAMTVLAVCYGKHLADDLYLVPLDGGTPTELSLPHGKGSPVQGFDARRIDSGLYLQTAGACGYYFVAHQRADGKATAVTVPHAVGSVWLIGGSGSDLVLQTTMSCDRDSNRSALLRFDPVTRAEHLLSLLPRDEEFADILSYGEPPSTGAL